MARRRRRYRPVHGTPTYGGAVPDRFRGTRSFPRPYRIMLQHYPPPRRSVDHALLERMVYVSSFTREYLYGGPGPPPPRYRKGERAEIEAVVKRATKGARRPETVIDHICSYLARFAEKSDTPWPELRFGGTEEEILARGTNLCGDLSRLACVAFQVAGFPSRLVFLANPELAYYGHGILEVWRQGAWGAVDCLSDVVYRHPDGRPASVWDLQHDAGLIERNRGGRPLAYVQERQFRAAGITEYPIHTRGDFTYQAGKVTPYYAAILEMADRGWPGGARWLHGEDSSK